MLTNNLSALSAGMVQFSVGANETPFDVHVELLCDRSPYFDSLYGDRTEKPISSDPISFPDEDPDIFAELLSWMYYGDASVELPPTEGISFLLKLWVLAGRFEKSQLQNHVIQLCRTEMDNKPNRIFGCDTIDYVYAHTLPQSPLRLLLADNWVRNASQARFLRRREHLSRPFLEDFCSALIEDKERTDDTEETGYVAERYHTQYLPLQDNHGVPLVRDRDHPELVQTATWEQLSNRNIKRPSSRIRNSPLLTPPHATTPSFTKQKDPKTEIAREMRDLQI